MKKAYYDLCYVNVEEAKASETETQNKEPKKKKEDPQISFVEELKFYKIEV